MADLVWIHEDALRQSHPVFAAAAPGSRAVFIWDNASLEAGHIGPKRRLFIYQTLAGMEIDIIAGTAASVILALIAKNGVTRLLVPGTPNPAFHKQLSDVRRACPDLQIDIIDDTPFVRLAQTPDLGRFFRYWNKAKKSALRHGGLAS